MAGFKMITEVGRNVRLCRQPIPDSGWDQEFGEDLLLYHRRIRALETRELNQRIRAGICAKDAVLLVGL